MQLRLSVIRIFRRVSERVRKLSSVGAAPFSESDPETGEPPGGKRAAPSQKGRGSDSSSASSDRRRVRCWQPRKLLPAETVNLSAAAVECRFT